MEEFAKNDEETQYLDLINRVLTTGSSIDGRNGRTLSVFGASMRFSLKDGRMPLITTKRLAWKTCFKELMWFLRGQTDGRILCEQNVHIWDANGTREFLNSRGLLNRDEYDLGPIYGFQWRHFNAEYTNCLTDYSGKGVDQLAYILKCLKDPVLLKENGRRLVMTAWNPCQLDMMALPPCHILCQFYVREGKYLSCSLYQRSGDIGLGVPFNIASYSFLTHMIAAHCGLIAEEFVYFLGDAHIYESHIKPLKIQISRIPLPFPKIAHLPKKEIEDYELEDIVWIERGYQFYDSIKMEMSV